MALDKNFSTGKSELAGDLHPSTQIASARLSQDLKEIQGADGQKIEIRTIDPCRAMSKCADLVFKGEREIAKKHFAKAEKLLQENVDLMKDNKLEPLGGNIASLAVVQEAQGKLPEAEANGKEAVRHLMARASDDNISPLLFVSKDGETKPVHLFFEKKDLEQTLNNLARVEEKLNKPEEAEKYRKTASDL